MCWVRKGEAGRRLPSSVLTSCIFLWLLSWKLTGLKAEVSEGNPSDGHSGGTESLRTEPQLCAHWVWNVLGNLAAKETLHWSAAEPRREPQSRSWAPGGPWEGHLLRGQSVASLSC